MHLIDWIIIAILAVAAGLALRHIFRHGSCSCGCSCGHDSCSCGCAGCSCDKHPPKG